MIHANLVVIKNKTLVFSEFFYKPNSTTTRNAWYDLVDGQFRHYIPLTEYAFQFLDGSMTSPIYSDSLMKGTGPSAVVIHSDGHVKEFSYTPEKGATLYSVMAGGSNSFYARSSSWTFEQAAAAADLIYDNAEDIYLAVMTALSGVVPKYRVVQVDEHAETLKRLSFIGNKEHPDLAKMIQDIFFKETPTSLSLIAQPIAFYNHFTMPKKDFDPTAISKVPTYYEIPEPKIPELPPEEAILGPLKKAIKRERSSHPQANPGSRPRKRNVGTGK